MASNPVLDDIRRIKRELTALQATQIKVGIQGDEGSEILMIASVHEFGCTITVTPRMRAFLHHTGLHMRETTEYVNIPERSFIRASYDAGQQGIEAVCRKVYHAVIAGTKTAQQAAAEIGAFCVQMTQEYVRQGNAQPPISEYTKEHRASSTDTPLFDTGTNIVDRITFKIEGGGG